LHPSFYISETGGESRAGDWGDGLGGREEEARRAGNRRERKKREQREYCSE